MRALGVFIAFPVTLLFAFPVLAADTPQPLTRADCSKAGAAWAWNENANVCEEASHAPKAQAAPAVMPKAEGAKTAEPGEPKAAKTSATKHAAKKKSAHRRKSQSQQARPAERHPFRLFPNWHWRAAKH